jgi:hypothetical protein
VKIYLVMQDLEYEGSQVRGAFETLEKAQQAAARFGLDQDAIDEWDVDDPELWPAGRPFTLTVYEDKDHRLIGTAWSYHEAFGERDTDWSAEVRKSGVHEGFRVHTRIVWIAGARGAEKANALAQLKAAELQRMPFDRETP